VGVTPSTYLDDLEWSWTPY